ncbi:hypothetical protein DM02DRAFT_644504 [Periconia macrospinosa]|uniref:TPR-like protein n=1 Tax=Periconia macrospinosa TaxID=97972 RepID=A0A2V1DFW7_9PLEO|nr:hypothetical protein DM02DRAFT_644504 [Periconia macrospinosa]
MVPFGTDPDFVDRPDILAWIHDMCAVPASRAALVGFGGAGSQSNIATTSANHRPKPIFWVHGGTRARFEDAYRDIADRLELPRRNEPGVNILKLVNDWLCDENNGLWPMVLDNADDIEVFFPKRQQGQGKPKESVPPSLATFLPQSDNGSILVTTRSKDAAVRLVGSTKITKALLRNEETCEENEMLDLVNALDCIPLAVRQAAAYINLSSRISVERYLVEFWKSDKKKSSLLNRDVGDLRRDESASNSVVTTWEMSFEQIRKERPGATDLLSLMSFFNAQNIPEFALRNSWRYISPGAGINSESDEDSDGDGDSDSDVDSEFYEILDLLLAYSLVRRSPDGKFYDIHPLAQFCIKERIPLAMKHWYYRTFIRLMAAVFPRPQDECEWKCHALWSHIEPYLDVKPTLDEGRRWWPELLCRAGEHLTIKSRFREAERLIMESFRVNENILGTNHLSNIRSMHSLGWIWLNVGKYASAEDIFKRTLVISEKELGEADCAIQWSLKGIADSLIYQRKFAEALETCMKLLATSNLSFKASAIFSSILECMVKLGSADSYPSTSVYLTSFLLQQGKYEEAEEMRREILRVKEKTVGAYHPSMLQALYQLLECLRNQGKYQETTEVCRHTLERQKSMMASGHTSILSTTKTLEEGKHAQEMLQRFLDSGVKMV